MKRAKLVALIVAMAIALMPIVATATTPPPSISGHSSGPSPIAVWLVMGCAASLIWAAWIANYTNNRQLTQSEAGFCGWGYWLRQQTAATR